jgi:hypothetical protein
MKKWDKSKSGNGTLVREMWYTFSFPDFFKQMSLFKLSQTMTAKRNK